MICRRYEASDYETISNWYKGHGHHIPRRTFFPGIGFIVEGIAVGFLFRTDSEVCIIEGFLSNKKAPNRDKAKAFDMIMESILYEAKRHYFSSIVGFSKTRSIEKLGKRFKFNKTKDIYSCLVKGI